MNKTLEMSDKDLQYFAKLIGAPTFNYMMKRIENHVLQDKNLSNISMNSFINIIIMVMASMDANTLKWIEEFFKLKTGEVIEIDKLKYALATNLNSQLGIEVH